MKTNSNDDSTPALERFMRAMPILISLALFGISYIHYRMDGETSAVNFFAGSAISFFVTGIVLRLV